MRKVRVALPQSGYDIEIGPGALGQAGRQVAALAGGQAVAVVSDETVWALHGAALGAALQAAGVRYTPVLVAPGEESKSLQVLQQVYSGFGAAGLARGGLVVAFGGGVVGDLAGFAAGTWMRGVRLVQLPTTLLAQVDSSVGGKTAVNLKAGKNLAGVFHQPVLVLADTALLATLPQREMRCGMAEVVKYGAIFSKELFGRLALPPGAQKLPGMVETCCRLKAEVVCRDERDTGARMLLNFGHTLGHAIEALGGFEAHNHGEAVAMGMVLAAAVGEKMGVSRAGCAQQLQNVLQAQGLPTACPYTAAQLVPAARLDKKGSGDGVDMVLLEDVGTARVEHVAFARLQQLLQEVL